MTRTSWSRGVVTRSIAACLLTLAARAADAQAPAGSAVITGRVTSEDGTPLPGANVFITEMTLSVGTSANGVYTITVPAARVSGQTVQLRVRSVGFSPQVKPVTLSAGSQTVNFSLRRDALRLSEVVVTGVSQATERVKVPFAVTRIDSTQTPVPGINPLAQLQGKVPGANIVASSGRPGVAPAVLLRGPKSINATGRSQEPLYIVDGVILQSSIADLNGQDIESVEVVKGAAAASLYGSQAANGVIQITTKRGKAARDGVRFGFRSEVGLSDIEREFGIAQRHALLMDASQTRFCISNGLTAAQARGCYRTINFTDEALRINDNPGDFATATSSAALDMGSTLQGNDARKLFQTNPWPGANYNAIDQLVNPQPQTINNVDMTGKFGATSIYATANNTQAGGAIKYLNGYDRNSVRLNADQTVGSKLQLALNTTFARSATDGFNQEGSGAAFFRLTRVPPIVDLERLDSRGRLLIRPNILGGGAQNENPLYSLQNIKRIDYRNRFVGSFTARYSPLTWLDADAVLGYDNNDYDGRQFSNRGFRTTGPAAATANNGALQNYAGGERSLNAAAGLAIPNFQPFRDLSITPTVRTQFLQQDYSFRNAQGSQLTVSDVEDLRNVTQTTLTSNTTRQTTTQMTLSGGLRAEYKERYILDGAIRRDGNSTFGPDQRWATYGRLAGAWLVSSESWMEGFSDKLNLLKLTANYGTSGLSPSFAAQYETYTIGNGGTLTPATLGNAQLKPQVDKGYELGLEIGAFQKWSLQATYALSNTQDQILEVPLAAAQGFQNQWQNAGTLQNSTVELSLGFPVFSRGSFDWSGRANFEKTVTTVTKLNVPAYTTGGTLQATENIFRVAEGEKFGTFYGRKFATACSDLPATFAAQCGGAGSNFQRNDDGLIVWTGGAATNEGYTNNLWNTSLPAAQSPFPGYAVAWGHPIVLRDPATGAGLAVPLGHALPDFRWSVNNNMSYKRLSMYALVDASVGQSVYNQSRGWSYLDFLSKDQDQTGRGTGDVKPASYYYRVGAPENSGVGGLYDVLGPNNFFTEKASFAKLRELLLTYRVGRVAGVGDWTVGVQGRNLHTWTDYKGFDPEVGLGTSAVRGFASQSGTFGSGALTAVDAFSFPNLRTFSFSLSTRF
jgi:TonB-linked SusC/RagA family outer membrane protein